ncbi:diaminopimelate epimerase [Sphingomonas gilva]|uniref:Diaminopimelate epimerase n=1 Tax=Sphingomonas gilva TaxID=2305907 RepID=A0A396RR26_9SPHN|nr:diaminopimelate epimerase [Sphingomonas gilva]
MRIGIVKCHGSGNDFPMIDGRQVTMTDDYWSGVAVALADRAGPVGGDGLLVLTSGGGGDFGMRMWNPDGSEAETCLNGLRCVARWGMEQHAFLTADVKLKTSSARVARVDDLAPGVATIREEVGPADLQLSYWPMNIGQDELVDEVCDRLPSTRAFTAIGMPNPHLVAFVDRIDDAELEAIGRFCEGRPRVLPNRANVSFVELRGTSDLFVRTFERGVGLTNSCGSAMAAAAYAACLTGRRAYDAPMTVYNAGGLVRATADGGGDVAIEGNATFEWRGEIEVDPARETARDLEIIERYEDEVAAWDAVVEGMVVPPRSDMPDGPLSTATSQQAGKSSYLSPEGERGGRGGRGGKISWDGFSAVTPGSIGKE